MGLFDIFKAKPSKEAILGQVRKAKEVYAQPEYRRMAMEKLLKWGNDESLAGVLERFSVVVQSPHWDEDEKRWLVDEIIKIGHPALPLLQEFILKKNEINHALLAYRTIASNDDIYKKLLIEALKARPASDHRTVQSKQELIAAVSEFEPSFFEHLIAPYLNDHSDDVQCATIDALSRSLDPAISGQLIALLESDAHSARVLRNAANVVAKGQLAIKEPLKLSEVLLEDFKMDAGHLVRLNHAAK